MQEYQRWGTKWPSIQIGGLLKSIAVKMSENFTTWDLQIAQPCGLYTRLEVMLACPWGSLRPQKDIASSSFHFRKQHLALAASRRAAWCSSMAVCTSASCPMCCVWPASASSLSWLKASAMACRRSKSKAMCS